MRSYIGLEFSDVYTALGSSVTFIEALDRIMPGFDTEIAKMAQRLLITPRNIDYHTGVFASKVTPGVPGVKPVMVELIDAKTKAHVETLELDAVLVATGRAPYTAGLNLGAVNAATDRRGFIPTDDHMQGACPAPFPRASRMRSAHVPAPASRPEATARFAAAAAAAAQFWTRTASRWRACTASATRTAR